MSGFPIARTEAHRSTSCHVFQAIIGASLETLKDFCVGSLHLAIALWVSNGGIADFYVKIFTIPLECAAGELGPIVSDDPIRDPKPVDDGLDKLDYGLLIDLDHRGRFRPLGEFVDCDIEIPVPSDGPGNGPRMSSPQTVNNHKGGIICSICASVWICLA
jgi:hypothetical protein